MEDIKILEEKIKEWEPYKNIDFPTESGKLIQKENQAIENLIKGYRELEYKYNKALTDLSIECKRTNEENYRCSLFAVENNDLKEKLANSIPKTKVKEKIEELDKQEDELKERRQKNKSLPLFEHNELLYCIPYTRSYLQELMEDK